MKRIRTPSELEHEFFRGWWTGTAWELRWWLGLGALALLSGLLVWRAQ